MRTCPTVASKFHDNRRTTASLPALMEPRSDDAHPNGTAARRSNWPPLPQQDPTGRGATTDKCQLSCFLGHRDLQSAEQPAASSCPLQRRYHRRDTAPTRRPVGGIYLTEHRAMVIEITGRHAFGTPARGGAAADTGFAWGDRQR